MKSQARHHFKTVFGEEVEKFLHTDKYLDLKDNKCDTIVQQDAVARILATNVEINGWNGLLT